MTHKSKYFSDSEFLRCNPPCLITDMAEWFILLLDEIREDAGIPLVLNCAYRSAEYDKSKGRSGNSAHTRGVAVDIMCNSSDTRHKIICAAIKNGITRIGIGKNFIHLDADDSLPQNVTWTYYD